MQDKLELELDLDFQIIADSVDQKYYKKNSKSHPELNTIDISLLKKEWSKG